MNVVRIDNSYAADLAVQFGYMKRKPNCIESYAYVRKGIVVSSVIYGNTPSPTVLKICGDDNSDEVIAINALWIKPNVDRQVMVDLLCESICMLSKDIVVMYCDKNQINVMRCLKDAGFLYVGMTNSQYDRSYEPEYKRTLFGLVEVPNRTHNLTAWYDKENTIVTERKRKHRFVYLKNDSYYDDLVYYEEDYPV